MDTKIWFRCGGEQLVIKFEYATPIITIADDKCITLSNVGRRAFIHHNSSENWKDHIEFHDFKEKHSMAVVFKVKPNCLRITPSLFSFKSEFEITGYNEKGEEM